MDVNKIQDLRKAIATALESVEEEFNVTIKWGNVTYGDIQCHGKLEVTDVSSETFPIQRAAFRQLVKQYPNGGAAKNINTTFTFGRHACKIIGYDTKKRKTPWIIEDSTGRAYPASAEQLERLLKVNDMFYDE